METRPITPESTTSEISAASTSYSSQLPFAGRHAGFNCGPSDCIGNSSRHPLVEDRRSDVLRVKLIFSHDGSNRLGGGNFHLIVDGTGADIEQTAEETREAADIINLVGVVRAPRGHHPHIPGSFFWHDFGNRVCHGKHDGGFCPPLFFFRCHHT